MSWATVPRTTRGLRLLAMSIAVLVAIVLGVKAAWACSCGGFWERMDAEMIFQGEVVEVHVPLHLQVAPRKLEGIGGIAWGLWFSVSQGFDDDVRTVFRVDKVWRGRLAQFVTVNTGSGLCCNCSLGKIFEKGHEYVVYAPKQADEIFIGFCGGRADAVKDMSPAELAMLGASTPVASGGRRVPMFWRHLLLPLALAAPIALAAIVWRRRSRKGDGATVA
jgi:hypothetical protein